jgi:hypothetical protein
VEDRGEKRNRNQFLFCESHEVLNFLKRLSPIILYSEFKVDWLWRHNLARWFSRNNQKLQVPNCKTPESLNGQNNAHSRIRANRPTTTGKEGAIATTMIRGAAKLTVQNAKSSTFGRFDPFQLTCKVPSADLKTFRLAAWLPSAIAPFRPTTTLVVSRDLDFPFAMTQFARARITIATLTHR